MTTINLSSIVSNYNAELKRIKDEMSENFQIELKTAFKEVFFQYPNIIKITWTQYTPFFNDGDPCIFRVTDLEIFDDETTGEIDPDDNDYDDDGEEGLSASWGEGAEKYPLLENMASALMQADELLLNMFGDHSKITVTSDGIDIEEYEHE